MVTDFGEHGREVPIAGSQAPAWEPGQNQASPKSVTDSAFFPIPSIFKDSREYNLSVLGADDDELLCETCNPPLSGVALTSEQSGFEAAALLDRMSHGKKPPAKPRLIAPTRIIVRQSTDTLAIDDETWLEPSS